MKKKFFTDEEMRKQWDDLDAAWVILDQWAIEKTGKPLKRYSMRPAPPLEADQKAPYPDQLAGTPLAQP